MNSSPPRRGTEDAKRAWLVGGVLLLTSVVIGLVLRPMPSAVTGSLAEAILFAACLVVFALGIRRAGSVTARHPLGTGALLLLAAWVLAESISLNFAYDVVGDRMLLLSTVSSLIEFALALVAVMQIARAGVVPPPWNWAPGWALAAVSAVWLMLAVAGIGASQGISPVLAAVLSANPEGLVRVGSRVFLGVLAIVLANRSRRPNDRTVPIYRSPTE